MKKKTKMREKGMEWEGGEGRIERRDREGESVSSCLPVTLS